MPARGHRIASSRRIAPRTRSPSASEIRLPHVPRVSEAIQSPGCQERQVIMSTFTSHKPLRALVLASSALAFLVSVGTVARAQGGYDPVLTTIEVPQLVATT